MENRNESLIISSTKIACTLACSKYVGRPITKMLMHDMKVTCRRVLKNVEESMGLDFKMVVKIQLEDNLTLSINVSKAKK